MTDIHLRARGVARRFGSQVALVFFGLVPREVAPVAGWLSDGLPFAHAVRYFSSALYDGSPWGVLARELGWLVGLGLLFGGLARAATRRLLA